MLGNKKQVFLFGSRRTIDHDLNFGATRSFRVETRDLGGLKPGLSLDNVAELIEQVEGPLHR